MDKPRCAADLFMYDDRDNRGLTMKDFYVQYKDKLPMLAVFIGGWDGFTSFDCYDNLQVFRIHGISSQPRVIALNDNESKVLDPKIHTIPVNTPIKFQVVRGPSKYDSMQTLEYILDNNPLPIQVKMACDPVHQLKIGTSHVHASSFGHLLITDRYLEHYFIVTLINGLELELNNYVNMVSLSEDLEAAAITGFKNRPQAEFDAYMKQLAEDLKRRGDNFENTQGNQDMAEYKVKDINPDTGQGGIPTWPHPPIPPLIAIEEEEDEYEEIPPELPGKPSLPPLKKKTDKKQPIKSEPRIISPAAIKQTEKDLAEMKAKQSKPLPQLNEGSYNEIPEKQEMTSKHKRKDHAQLPTGGKHYSASGAPNKTSPKPISPVDRPQMKLPKSSSTGVSDSARTPGSHMRVTAQRSPTGGDKPRNDIYSETYEDVDPSKGGRYVKLEGITSIRRKPSDSTTNEQQLKSTSGESSTEQRTYKGVNSMTIAQVGDVLDKLKLGQYRKDFAENQIDGEILSSLTPDDLQQDLSMKKIEAVRLFKYTESGHIPK